jgi:hypothetical protein
MAETIKQAKAKRKTMRPEMPLTFGSGGDRTTVESLRVAISVLAQQITADAHGDWDDWDVSASKVHMVAANAEALFTLTELAAVCVSVVDREEAES